MRYGIDMHVLDGKPQGSRTHCIELFSRLILSRPEDHFFLFTANPELARSTHSSFRLPNVSCVRLPAWGAVLRYLVLLPVLAILHRLNVIHTQYVIPPFTACMRVVTIHDVLYESHPQYFTALFTLRSKLIIRWSARRADMVFTVSEYSKREIIRYYGLRCSDIIVLKNGVNSERFFHRVEVGSSVKEFDPRLASGRFFLTVGRLEPRKNHVGMLQALALLMPEVPPLVVVGKRDFQYNRIFEDTVRLNLSDRVIFLESVSDDSLAALYSACICFLYPSFVEGFGMPVVEAMACGAPVVTSRAGALSEIAEGAGLLINPQDAVALSDAMRNLMHDESLRRTLCAAGLERAASFSWTSSAELLSQNIDKLAIGATKN